MGVFTFFSYSSRSVEIAAPVSEQKAVPNVVQVSENSVDPNESQSEGKSAPEPILEPALPIVPSSVPAVIPTIVVSKPSNAIKSPTIPVSEPSKPSPNSRRISLRIPAFPFTRAHEEHKPVLSAIHEQSKKANVSAAFLKRAVLQPRFASTDKRARKSALVVRSLIIGGSTSATPQLTSINARPQLSKLKTQLMEPKSANKVIAHLRALPMSDDVSEGKSSRGPIHAVCLEHADADEDKLHFSALATSSHTAQTTSFFDGRVSVDEVTEMFSKMNVVSLIKSPGLGIGEPGDGEGLLSGAVPTAETVLKGFEQITPQLMALGYATGRSVWVDHAGLYPPTDRMSIFTYWWGLELVLPPPSLKNLAQAKSISGTVINFLTALSLINNGVREILPFVRYIAQFIDFEFNTITQQDKGQGVVCASTWIMPAALVPRPWDFASPPPVMTPPVEKSPTSSPSPAANLNLSSEQPTLPSATALSEALQPPSHVDSIVGAYANSVTFQSIASPLKAEALPVID